MRRRHFAQAALGVLGAQGAIGCSPPRQIYLLRHAEKALSDPAAKERDPKLSDEGRARAEALVGLFREVRVTRLYASEWRRTQETLLPLSIASGVEIRVRPASDVDALVRELEQDYYPVAVVCGHSNTVPLIAQGLGLRETIAVGEGDFGDVFQLVFEMRGVTLTRLRYEAI